MAFLIRTLACFEPITSQPLRIFILKFANRTINRFINLTLKIIRQKLQLLFQLLVEHILQQHVQKIRILSLHLRQKLLRRVHLQIRLLQQLHNLFEHHLKPTQIVFAQDYLIQWMETKELAQDPGTLIDPIQ